MNTNKRYGKLKYLSIKTPPHILTVSANYDVPF